MKNATPVTWTLIAANVLMFLLQGQSPTHLGALALWPLGHGFAPWQVVTSAFLHGSTSHLALNMFGLWMFGSDVERALGRGRFSLLYLVSVLTASMVQLVVVSFFTDPVPTVGASGGLFGVMAAFAVLYPTRRIALMIVPIPVPSPIFVTLYAAFELWAGVTGTQAGVAHFAHLGGLVGGLLAVGMRRPPPLER